MSDKERSLARMARTAVINAMQDEKHHWAESFRKLAESSDDTLSLRVALHAKLQMAMNEFRSDEPKLRKKLERYFLML